MNIFIRDGSNLEADGNPLYDGFLLGGNTEAMSIPYPAGQGKIISIYAETDINFAYLDRASLVLNEYRQYELAGVAHLPKPLLPLDANGATRQNPADFSPVYRAIISHLAAWIRNGDEPPPSRLIDGAVQPDGTFVPERDADGNALGGLRLPHMPSVICDDDHCDAAGAPLGTYTGLETIASGLFVGIGGTFDPFSPEELQEPYETRGNYVRLVQKAAEELREQGYILQEDYTQYVSEAAHQPLW